MNEKPMIFNGEMVRVLLEGMKTQDRRPIKPRKPKLLQYAYYGAHPGGGFWGCDVDHVVNNIPFVDAKGFDSPYKVGDLVWVEESFWIVDMPGMGDCPCYIYEDEIGKYQIDNTEIEIRPLHGMSFGHHPSSHMPREASRITLEINKVRVEHVQDISKEDAKAEGITNYVEQTFGMQHSEPRRIYPAFPEKNGGFPTAKEAYEALWNSIYGKTYPWDSNPWVFVYEFKRIKP